MATMTATATILKSSNDSKSASVLDAYHHPQLSTGHQSHHANGYSFPYLAYKSPEGLPLFEPSHKATAINSTEAFLLKSNLILRSSSLYDNSNYAITSRHPSSPGKFAHPDFTDSHPMHTKPSVITNNLPRVEIAKVSQSASNKSSAQQENPETRHRRALERLTPEEMQQLHRLVYKHFANNRGNKGSGSLVHDPVPVDYNEEDPHTWPSNWLSQAPAMIIEPDKYLAQKPMLNSFQRQLIRRISHKYEPLVAHYLQQLLVLRVASEEARKSSSANSRLAGTEDSVGNSSVRLGKPRQPMVKSASLSSALSSSARIDSINSASQHNSADHQHHPGDLGGYCHKEAGTLLTSTGVKPELNAGSARNGALKSTPYVHDDNGRPSVGANGGANLRQSSLDSSSRSPKMADRENRLTRLSQQMANKWSNKMKVYLRKN